MEVQFFCLYGCSRLIVPDVLTQDQDQQDQDQDLTPASQETVVASDGSVPALVITQAEEVSREPDGK